MRGCAGVCWGFAVACSVSVTATIEVLPTFVADAGGSGGHDLRRWRRQTSTPPDLDPARPRPRQTGSRSAHRHARSLLEAVLGNAAPETLSFAVSGAETKWEGVALLLVSPALMRR